MFHRLLAVGVLALALAAPAAVTAQDFNMPWQSWDKAVAQSAATGKPIFVYSILPAPTDDAGGAAGGC